MISMHNSTAFVANEHRRSCNELTHFMLALAAERTIKSVLRLATTAAAAVADFAHTKVLSSVGGLKTRRYPVPKLSDRPNRGESLQI